MPPPFPTSAQSSMLVWPTLLSLLLLFLFSFALCSAPFFVFGFRLSVFLSFPSFLFFSCCCGRVWASGITAKGKLKTLTKKSRQAIGGRRATKTGGKLEEGKWIFPRCLLNCVRFQCNFFRVSFGTRFPQYTLRHDGPWKTKFTNLAFHGIYGRAEQNVIFEIPQWKFCFQAILRGILV